MKAEIGQFLDYIDSDAVSEEEAYGIVVDWCEQFVEKY
jgi:hypothetical protein